MTTLENETPPPDSRILQMMQELQELQESWQDIKEYIEAACEPDVKRVHELRERVKKIEAEIEVIHAGMQERERSAFDDFDAAAAAIARKEDDIKKACHNLPLNLLGAASKFRQGHVIVSVSKASVSTSYSERLLDDHPELHEVYVDGDPIVVRKVNAVLLDRYVAEGGLSAADVAPYKILVKERSPQVRIAIEKEPS